MKVAVLTALLTTMVFAGCISTSDDTTGEAMKPDLDYNPEDISVSGVESASVTVESFDGTSLDTLIYYPLTQDSLPDRTEPPFPVIVFMHGWGFPKEVFENHQDELTGQPYSILEEFAQQGFITVAYDARGWGRSGGQSSFGFTNEMKDFDAVVNHVNTEYKTNGQLGVTGQSYGAGQALRLWAENDNVTTVVPHSGWIDLYEGIVPGNVPKLEWMEFLYLFGIAGSGAQLSPEIHEWYQSAYTREGLDDIRSAMDLRSVGDAVLTTDKPLFTCQGMEETLFPQSHDAWQNTPGFARAYYYTGGHNARDGECWDRTLDWFLYFLQGKDNGVDGWPELTSVDVSGGEPFEFDVVPEITTARYHLRTPDFTEYSSTTTFTISQRFAANPLEEATVVWGTADLPRNAIPAQLRQDPTGVLFTSAALTESKVILGAPEVVLEGAAAPGFQVVGTLYHIIDGNSRVLGYGAYSAVEDQHMDDVRLEFPWMKVEMSPGDQYQLKLASNQPAIYSPYPGNYDVSFTGNSTISLPFVA
jgi:predicted acyl esterase